MKLRLALLAVAAATLLATPVVAQPYGELPGAVYRQGENFRQIARQRSWVQWQRERPAYCRQFPRYCREHFDLWYDRYYGGRNAWPNERH